MFLQRISLLLLHAFLLLLPLLLVSFPSCPTLPLRGLILLILLVLWSGLETMSSTHRKTETGTGNTTGQWLPMLQGVALYLSFAGAMLELQSRAVRWPVVFVFFGVVGVGGGMVLRLVSIQTLKDEFLDEVRLLDSHTLVSSGIYRWIRHPSEAGNLLILVGTVLLTGTWFPLAMTVFVWGPLLLLRLSLEEKLLLERFGKEFQEYRQQTGALWPRWRALVGKTEK